MASHIYESLNFGRFYLHALTISFPQSSVFRVMAILAGLLKEVFDGCQSRDAFTMESARGVNMSVKVAKGRAKVVCDDVEMRDMFAPLIYGAQRGWPAVHVFLDADALG